MNTNNGIVSVSDIFIENTDQADLGFDTKQRNYISFSPLKIGGVSQGGRMLEEGIYCELKLKAQADAIKGFGNDLKSEK